ncbi:hypothetical protein BGZ65_005157 [Modicella reniformis]|uniref:FYVE-type domain-containing protein n=1 Tax=Modicella reniformis TaxID=1440133 RepID=A0A9P6IN36_9FUNG|nr:hypothetical protein BGZ65_005157 [Modicella reniformis]
MQSHGNGMPKRDQISSTDNKAVVPSSAQQDKGESSNEDDDSCYDDDDDQVDDSEYSEDDDDDDDDELDEDSEMDDSESDHESIVSVHTETVQSRNSPAKPPSREVLPPPPPPPTEVQPATRSIITSESSQTAQQQLLAQLTITAGAWSTTGSHCVSNHVSADKGDLANNRSSTNTRREAAAAASGTEPLHAPPTIRVTTDPSPDTQAMPSPNARAPVRPSQEQNGQPSAAIHQAAKGRMVPYVHDQEEDEEDDEDYDEGSEEYDDEEDEEDDYSYSEDDGEDDEEEDEYHYGGAAQEDPKEKSAAKPRAPHSGYPRNTYHHYRPRLDENYLKKRAITKQVVRRSSLTALLGEASQPETVRKDHPIRPSGSAFVQHQRHNGSSSRRPALQNVWADSNTRVTAPRSGINNHAEAGTGNSDPSSRALLNSRESTLVDTRHPSIVEHNAQESHQPRRTDSGVEVKVAPNQQRDPTSDSNPEKGQDLVSATVTVATELPSSSSSSTKAPASREMSTPSIVITLGSQSRIKSEGCSPKQGPQGLCSSMGALVPAGSASAPNSSQVCKPLKSSISCHTFPRASGKRVGQQKHVSWHYSLFPTQHALRVKPSVPSLSSVAAESAKATLSQLASIPVMTRDNVKDYQQTIRSLRTLSRIEITKMSYKQQGRQELTSVVPISKSAYDSIPWWNPSRWIRGSVTINKRHWKPDNSRESCAYCFAPFHRLTNPRHHCRKCGDIFCSKCASAEILMDAKNCVYVQQSQLARWSRRVDLQRNNLWVDTLPQLHPVRTAAESAFVGNAGTDGHGSIGHATGMTSGASALGCGASGNGSHRGSWQAAAGVSKKNRLSIFGLFNNGAPASTAGNTSSDSRRGSMDISSTENAYTIKFILDHEKQPGKLVKPFDNDGVADRMQ